MTLGEQNTTVPFDWNIKVEKNIKYASAELSDLKQNK